MENKTVEKILPMPLALLLTYLKLSGLSLGLNIKWDVILLGDGLSSLMAEDFVEVGEMGIRGKSAAIEDLKANFTLKEYSMEDAKVVELGKDAALVTYKLAQKGSYKGQDLPSKTNCSAAYVRRGGKWLNISFQQTAAK